MKKFRLQAVIALFVAAIAISCSKDEETKYIQLPVAYGPENPLEAYLTAAGFSDITPTNYDPYEFGYRFRPIAAGTITGLTAKIPATNSALRVTLWDVATATPIKTELLNVTSSGTAVTKTIEPVAVAKDKEYMITMNSDSWYYYKKPDSSNTIYPFTIGNIQITGYGSVMGAAQAYPVASYTNFYAGDLSIIFQRAQ